MSAKVLRLPTRGHAETIAREAAKQLQSLGMGDGCVRFVQEHLAEALEDLPLEFSASGSREEVQQQIQAWADEFRNGVVLRLAAAYVRVYRGH